MSVHPEAGSDGATRLEAARAAVVPAIGERAADLVTLALLRSVGRLEAADAVAGRIRARGDDPDLPPEVTEAERTMLDWAADLAPDTAGDAALDAVAGPDLRAALVALRSAALTA